MKASVCGRFSLFVFAGLMFAVSALGAKVPAQGVDRALLKELLEVPSESHNFRELHRSLAVVRAWLEARGVWCTIETNSAGYAGLLAATRPGKVHDYLFVSHVDVVPAPRSMFTYREEGDRFFARGACDTKGNVVAICSVLANLAGTRADVACFLATDEEGGPKAPAGHTPPEPTAQMMIARGYRARRLILVADTAGEEPGQLFTAEKGHARITLTAHGRGGHSSRPWALDNPVPKLCRAYLQFQAAWERGADLNERWRTVLSPTVVKASEAGNIVPDQASMVLSCRYINMADYHRAVAELKATGLEVKASPGRLPVVNRPGEPEIAALLKAMNAAIPGGMREGKMSAATDASFFSVLGVPIVIWTALGGEPHSDREWGSLASLDDYVDFFTGYFSGALNPAGK